MRHPNLFVFDIETIPDTEATARLLGIGADELDTQTLRDHLAQYHLEITQGKNDFPRQPFHRVVAISFLTAEIHRDEENESYVFRELRSGGREDASERDLLLGFFQHLERIKPRLVTFNGRGFDLPVLKYRAMKHGITASWLHTAGDKWNHYGHRYSTDWHCDLVEVLSDFGASARVKLNEVCAVFGIPGKMETEGADVAALYDAGDLAAIRDYCELDVLNTYLVYLRHMLHTARITRDAHDQAIDDILAMIDREGAERPHLTEFRRYWEAACEGQFRLSQSSEADGADDADTAASE